MAGPIVALRSPSYHHSDVVRLKAVDRPTVRANLGHLRDVIVLSTKKLGDRSPAAVMSGGDFDGDKVIFTPVCIATGLWLLCTLIFLPIRFIALTLHRPG